MTLWGRLARRPGQGSIETRRLETPDGDFVDLLRLPALPGSPRVLVLHGLEGSGRSHYIGALFDEMRQRGWGMDVLLFRSCGRQANRMPRFYHSGETGDLDYVLDTLTREFPDVDFVLAGFSLGGNVLLKWLGERGSNLPPRLRAAVAVSVPFDLARSSRRIGTGFSKIYEQTFLRSLKRKARAKARQFPTHPVLSRFEAAKSLYEFDDMVTAPLHGFADAADYYSRSSAIRFLSTISLPTLLLSATDDPFLPSEVLDSVREIVRDNPALIPEFVPRGGHVGFVGGRWPWTPEYYAERRIAEFCAGYVEQGVSRDQPALFFKALEG